MKTISAMKDRLTGSIASYRKDCACRQLQKMDSDIDKLLTPEQLTQFRASEPALAAVKVLGVCSEKPCTVSQSDFVIVRDFLVTEIAIANAKRSSVLANMTVDQFAQARLVDGLYVVSAADHKTSCTYGPAKIVLSSTLHRWISVYTQSVRPTVIISADVRAELFVSWNGESLTSGQITRAVQSIWKKAGFGEQITMNIVRNTAVSAIHQKCPEMSLNLADLMCHRVRTAQGCYRLIEREKSSVSVVSYVSYLCTSC